MARNLRLKRSVTCKASNFKVNLLRLLDINFELKFSLALVNLCVKSHFVIQHNSCGHKKAFCKQTFIIIYLRVRTYALKTA